MTTPQNPGVRRRQKARRTKQLAQWREKNETTKASATKSDEPKKAVAKKA